MATVPPSATSQATRDAIELRSVGVRRGGQATVQLLAAGVFAFGLLGAHSDGALWLVGLVAFGTALVGTALGLLSSAIARTEFQAVVWMALIVLPQVILCGLLTPRSGMAPAAPGAAAVMPLSYAYDLLDRLGDDARPDGGSVARRNRTAATPRRRRGPADVRWLGAQFREDRGVGDARRDRPA